jgi:hypothetical protein
MHRRVAIGVSLLFLCCAIGVAQSPDNNPANSGGQKIVASGPPDHGTGPLANTSAANARVIPPDGTSLYDSFTDGATQWFTTRVEAGKSYVVEALDPYEDLGGNSIGDVAIFEADGTTPMTNAWVNCSSYSGNLAPATAPPSLEVGNDGRRCIVRPFTAGNPPPKNITIRVTEDFGPQFQIRMRESTIYGRWTVNGYDMHVEIQNTSAQEVDVETLLYSDAGDLVGFNFFEIPAYGSSKVVYPHNSINPNRGTLRVIADAFGNTVFVPGQVNLQTYAYNTGSGTYLFFTPWRINDGQTANSW